MTRLRWDRKNGGYELEPWQKSQYKKKRPVVIKSSDEIKNTLGKHQTHNLTKKVTYSGGFKKHLVWCNTCNHHIKFITEIDYQTLDIPNTRETAIQTMLQDDIISFGKYRGKSINELPDDYLKWAILNLDPHISNQLIIELQRRYPEYR